MYRLFLACGLASLWLVTTPSQASAQVTYDKDWSYNQNKDYYYKYCAFPQGGYQFLIYYKSRPQWVYWYNPVKKVFWCACPTVNHPVFGVAIQNGEDLFLVATTPARNREDCVFPNVGKGENFKKGKAKDKDGSDVDLSCPPPDLP